MGWGCDSENGCGLEIHGKAGVREGNEMQAEPTSEAALMFPGKAEQPSMRAQHLHSGLFPIRLITEGI